MTPTHYVCPVCGHGVVAHLPMAPQTCDHRGTVHDARRPAVLVAVEDDEKEGGR